MNSMCLQVPRSLVAKSGQLQKLHPSALPRMATRYCVPLCGLWTRKSENSGSPPRFCSSKPCSRPNCRRKAVCQSATASCGGRRVRDRRGSAAGRGLDVLRFDADLGAVFGMTWLRSCGGRGCARLSIGHIGLMRLQRAQFVVALLREHGEHRPAGLAKLESHGRVPRDLQDRINEWEIAGACRLRPQPRTEAQRLPAVALAAGRHWVLRRQAQRIVPSMFAKPISSAALIGSRWRKPSA